MKLSAEVRAFAARLGHDFARPELLVTALTHASLSSETRSDNERLEFLGDRVLGLVMAEALLDADKGASEGQLAPRYNALVRKETCADVAREVGLGDVLKLGRSEMLSGGRKKAALLGDGMEAVIAAVSRDAGMEVARAMILRLSDAKTALQEWAQARKMSPPSYVEIARSGPDHAPEFTIEAQLANGKSARAKAGSKRVAEQAAAKALMDEVGA